MSLRPAQELVQESSKFSLRQFFEAQAVRSPAELPAEGFPTLNAQPDLGPPSPAAAAAASPFLRAHAPIPSAMGAPFPPPKDGKFTFTGMMPVTTPIQRQHKIIQQHQQQSLSQPSTAPKPTGLQGDVGNEVMRLKAHVVSLSERLAQTGADLATTSESVIRGNKALTSERVQFHAKYASMTKKLEATQAALAEAEALPKEDTAHSELLNAKVVELQLVNEKLLATRDALAEQLSEKEVAALDLAGAQRAEEDLANLRSKFTSLSMQHSTLLDKAALLEKELEAKVEMLELAETGAGAANGRAEAWEAKVAELEGQLEASKVEIAQTDSLVDRLDEQLAVARMGAEPEVQPQPEPTACRPEPEKGVGGCCQATVRCEEMERVAREAFDKTNGAREHECARLHEEWKFRDSLARRARAALASGEPERVMVAHVNTGGVSVVDEAPFDLASHIGANPLVMGKTIDENCLHCQAATTDAAAAAPPRDTSCAETRTNAFVAAVSKDLKFSMDGSQALYASSATTGAALRV